MQQASCCIVLCRAVCTASPPVADADGHDSVTVAVDFRSKYCACVLTAVGEMPWKAFPFGDPRIDHLSQMYV